MDPTSWASVNQPLVQGLNHKIYTFHATAEYTIRNNSESQVAIVEAYFIRGKRRMPQAYVHNPTDLYNNGFNRQTIAFDPNTGNMFDAQLAANQIGVTPFQNALFCRHLTITRRQKFIIAPGDEVSFVILGYVCPNKWICIFHSSIDFCTIIYTLFVCSSTSFPVG